MKIFFKIFLTVIAVLACQLVYAEQMGAEVFEFNWASEDNYDGGGNFLEATLRSGQFTVEEEDLALFPRFPDFQINNSEEMSAFDQISLTFMPMSKKSFEKKVKDLLMKNFVVSFSDGSSYNNFQLNRDILVEEISINSSSGLYGWGVKTYYSGLDQYERITAGLTLKF